MGNSLATSNWDKAYLDGKYKDEPAIPLVHDIIAELNKRGFTDRLGLYPGCGNGRNFVQLIDAGLKLEGNDISPVAVQQLKSRRPDAVVSVADFLTMPEHTQYWYLLSIQLFQHCNNATKVQLFDKAAALLQPQGLFVLRVNSVNTEIIEEYDLVEGSPDSGFTIRYKSGQKTGQYIHFYSDTELHQLTKGAFKVVMPLREDFTARSDGTRWAQWETILEKR